AYFDLVRDTLKALKAAGKLRDLDTTVATFSLFGMLLWLPHWYRPEGALTSQQVIEETLRLALGGLLKAPAGTRTRFPTSGALDSSPGQVPRVSTGLARRAWSRHGWSSSCRRRDGSPRRRTSGQ